MLVHISFYICRLIISLFQIKTIKVSNIAVAASENDIMEFFSFSGDIHYVEMQRSAPLIYGVLFLLSFVEVIPMN